MALSGGRSFMLGYDTSVNRRSISIRCQWLQDLEQSAGVACGKEGVNRKTGYCRN
jgi:hypothetical protein